MIKNKLRKIRLKRGLSLEQLAKDTKVSSVTIFKAEKEDANPKRETMDEIAIALNLPVQDIWHFKSKRVK